MYAVFDKTSPAYDWQKNELVRDILSLVNGNTHTVGEAAYLIIGVEENQQDPTQHQLHPVPTFELSAKQILDWVNAYAEPPIEELQAEFVTYNETQLYIITIPPSVHVHRLKRDLETGKNKVYHENITFMRLTDQIRNASPDQIEALTKAKKHAAAIQRNIHPVWGGAIIGAILFGLLINWLNVLSEADITQDIILVLGRLNANLFVRGIMATIGGMFGAGLGYVYMRFQDGRRWFIKASKHQRVVNITLGLLAFVLYLVVLWLADLI